MDSNNSISASTSQASLPRPGDLFRESWTVFKAHWKLLCSIVAIPLGISFISQLLFLTANPLAAIIGSILAIATLILSIAMKAALIDAVRQVSSGSTVTSIKAEYKLGFSLFWSFILLAIILSFVTIGSLALLIIPGLIVSVYCYFYSYALVIDGKKGFSALVESYRIVRGRWWPVVGRALYFGVMILVVYLIAAGLGWVVNLICGFAPKSGGAGFVIYVVNLLVAIGVGPLASIYMYKLYVALKATSTDDGTTGTFKKWLVAFLVIGIIATIIGIGIAFAGIAYLLSLSLKTPTLTPGGGMNPYTNIPSPQ